MRRPLEKKETVCAVIIKMKGSRKPEADTAQMVPTGSNHMLDILC